MTPQEQQLVQGLIDRVNQTSLTEKDPEAERYLQDTLGRNPDALYILAQTVLVQQYALDQAKKQLEDARAQSQKHTSFLGNLLGLNDQPAPPPPPPQPVQYTPVPNYAPPPPQYGSPYGSSYGAPQYGVPSQQGGFLRSALTTATGVAAGALAFEGIESLMHGFGEHAGYGGGSGFGSFGESGRPEIINNYYGESAQHGDLSPDIEDRRNDNPHFADTDTFGSSSNDTDSFADTSADDAFSSDSDSGDDFSSNDDNSF